MSTLSVLLRNTGLSVGSDLSLRIANTVLFVSITHFLGADLAGAFSLGVTYYLITSRFGFWGFDHLLVREVSPKRDLAPKFLLNFGVIRIGIAGLLILVVSLVVWNLPYSLTTRIVIIVMLLAVLPENISNLCQSVYIAQQRLEFVGLVSVVVAATTIGLSLVVLASGASVIALAAVFTLNSFVGLAVYLWLLLPQFSGSVTRLDFAFCRRYLHLALPFVLISSVFVVDNRTDVLLVSFLLDERSVGIYTAALTIVTALALLPQGVRTAIFPVLAQRFRTASEGTDELYESVFKHLLIMALPVAAGVGLLAGPIINLLYPPEFAPAAGALRILVWWFVFYSLNVLNSRVLIVKNEQRLIARFLVIGLAVNALVSVLLTPRIGLNGAAAARVAAAAAIFIQSELAIRRVVGKASLLTILVRPILACAAMAAVVWLVGDLGIWLKVLIGAAVYTGFVAINGTFTHEEKTKWRKTLTEVFRKRAVHDTTGAE